MLVFIGLLNIAVGFLPPIDGLSYLDWGVGITCLATYIWTKS